MRYPPLSDRGKRMGVGDGGSFALARGRGVCVRAMSCCSCLQRFGVESVKKLVQHTFCVCKCVCGGGGGERRVVAVFFAGQLPAGVTISDLLRDLGEERRMTVCWCRCCWYFLRRKEGRKEGRIERNCRHCPRSGVGGGVGGQQVARRTRIRYMKTGRK